MRLISYRFTLSTIIAIIVSAIPVNAQTPLPAPSVPAPICPAATVSSNPTWTFFAPGQSCSTTFKAKNFGQVDVTNVDATMITVDPLSGVPQVADGGTTFTVTSGAKPGQTKFTVNFAADPSKNGFIFRSAEAFTIVNKY